MKKFLFISIIFFSLSASAQFVQGVGIMGGLTLPREKWWLTTIEGTQKEKQKYYWIRYNGELFMEFIDNENFHWRTEFEYDAKGTKARVTGEKNRLSYISWNNYLLGRIETYRGYPYLLIGPRVEYLLMQSTPSIPYGFKPFHFSWSAGAGFEFITFGQFKPLVEFHYNPDIDKAVKGSAGDDDAFSAKNRAWELRVGLKFVFQGTKSCPAVYK